ncbi:MAG: sugar phosphate isomerase/epimerase family protein [Demequina sp.]
MTARLSLNQATIKRATLAEAIAATIGAGIPAIGLWRDPVAELGLTRVVQAVKDSGLRVSSLCRGGFFTAEPGPVRDAALDDNRRALDEAAALGAPALVLVAGGLPAGSRDLVAARARVADALEALVPHAAQTGVALAIEPLHPMYAADRAVVSTLDQALDLAAPFPAEQVQVVIDAFHVWWDPTLATAIARAGRERRIACYQACDFVTPIAPDALLSRGIPGDGHIDFAHLTGLVNDAGYRGDVEVEVFRQEVWDAPAAEVAARVADAHRRLVAPYL